MSVRAITAADIRNRRNNFIDLDTADIFSDDLDELLNRCAHGLPDGQVNQKQSHLSAPAPSSNANSISLDLNESETFDDCAWHCLDVVQDSAASQLAGHGNELAVLNVLDCDELPLATVRRDCLWLEYQRAPLVIPLPSENSDAEKRYEEQSCFPESRVLYLKLLGRAQPAEEIDNQDVPNSERCEHSMAHWFLRKERSFRPNWSGCPGVPEKTEQDYGEIGRFHRTR